MISYEDCIQKGLLRKISSSIIQADEQLNKARVLFEEAQESFEIENYNSAVMAGYAAMFDAARAILFKDGYREKSHACVARYLEAKYSKEIELETVQLLDQYRYQRHKVMYGSDFYSSKEGTQSLLDFAGKFIEVVAAILES